MSTLVPTTKIREWGGWGIRWVPGKGVAYNVWGKGGVELELSCGKRVFIGSQRPKELAQAIGDMMGQRKRS